MHYLRKVYNLKILDYLCYGNISEKIRIAQSWHDLSAEKLSEVLFDVDTSLFFTRYPLLHAS